MYQNYTALSANVFQIQRPTWPTETSKEWILYLFATDTISG